MRSKRLIAAERRAEKATKSLHEAIRLEYPPGTNIVYGYHDGENVRATVIETSLDRVRLRGVTGKVYMIYAGRIKRIVR